MPIYDQSYKHWDGAFRKRMFRWTPMVGYHLRLLFRKKVLWLILFMSYAPALIIAVLIYFTSPKGVAAEEVDALDVVTRGIEEALRVGPTAEDAEAIFGEGMSTDERFLEISRKGFFLFLLIWQGFFVVLTTSTVGAGLIARDVRSNALEIYLTKPISRIDYVLGKLAVIGAFIFQVTFVPSALLFLVASALWPGYFEAAFPIVPRLFVACLVAALVNGLVILALSSLTRSSRFATVIWFACCFLSLIAGELLNRITGDPYFYLISYRASFEYAFDSIFDAGVMKSFIAGGDRMVLAAPFGMLLAYALVSVLVLRRTIQGREIRT